MSLKAFSNRPTYLLNDFLKYIATLGFIGYIPFAQGTFGTLAAVIFMVILKLSLPLHIGLTVFL